MNAHPNASAGTGGNNPGRAGDSSTQRFLGIDVGAETIKVVEILLMSAGTVALWLNPAGGTLPLIVLSGMGVHSALFSPSKYGILPELIPHERLAAGNGLLELWTFTAILTGTAAGGFLLQSAGVSPWLAPFGLTLLSLVGFSASFAIPHVPPARSGGGIGATVRGAWSAIRTERLLRLAEMGSDLLNDDIDLAASA